MALKYKDLLGGLSENLHAALDNPTLLGREFNEMEAAKAFGLALKTLRQCRGLSLKALEQATEIPNPTINRYENAINIPTISQALKLCGYFGLSIEIFVALGVRFAENPTEIAEFYERFFDNTQIR